MNQEKTEVVRRQLSLKLAVLALIVLAVILAILVDFEKSSITTFLLIDSFTIHIWQDT